MESELVKRQRILRSEVLRLKSFCDAIILTGSLAYAPETHISTDSDIDLILITNDLKSVGAEFVKEAEDKYALNTRFFDGYCLKHKIEKVDVSYHVLSRDAFDIITKCFVADIRVFRKKAKDGNYILRNFEGEEYEYEITNKTLIEFENGYRTIVPVSFIKSDRYYNGVYRDKLLCCPKILHDINSIVWNGINKLWETVVINLKDESYRLYGNIDLTKGNIRNTLAKSAKLGKDRIEELNDRTIRTLGIIQ